MWQRQSQGQIGLLCRARIHRSNGDLIVVYALMYSLMVNMLFKILRWRPPWWIRPTQQKTHVEATVSYLTCWALIRTGSSINFTHGLQWTGTDSEKTFLLHCLYFLLKRCCEHTKCPKLLKYLNWAEADFGDRHIDDSSYEGQWPWLRCKIMTDYVRDISTDRLIQ